MKVRKKKRRPAEAEADTRSPTIPPPEDRQLKMEAFLGHEPPAKSRRRSNGPKRSETLSPLEAAVRDADIRSASGNWEGAAGKTFVGLYAVCHRVVYGILPEDLDAKGAITMAARHAMRCLHNEFQDDRDAFVAFIVWTWEREQGREEWGLRNGVSRSRLGVMFQFSKKLVTDYRVEQTRQVRRKRIRR